MLRRLMGVASIVGAVLLGTPAMSRAGEPETERAEARLEAHIEVLTPQVRAASELRVAIEVKNAGSAPAEVNATLFPLPSVVLEVRNAEGQPVPKAPPPVPPRDLQAGVRALEPGEVLRIEHSGAALFGIPLSPGTYEIRFRAPADPGELTSSWATFRVG